MKTDLSRTRFLRLSLRNQKSNCPLFNIRNDSNLWMVDQARFRILKPPLLDIPSQSSLLLQAGNRISV